MFIHITPKIYRPAELAFISKCILSEIHIPELDVTLVHGEDIDTRKPYPNKNYFVGCRKKGRKAIEGLFVESPTHLSKFTVINKWLVDGEGTVTHKVNYRVLDNEFDAVSDSMILWHATSESLGSWEDRTPENMKPFSKENLQATAPVNLQPRMDLIPGKRSADFEDELNDFGLIHSREETFTLPTIQKERFESFGDNGRLPSFDHAICSKTHKNKIGCRKNTVNWPVIQSSVLSCDFKASEAQTKLKLGDKEYSLHLNIKQDMHAMYWCAVNIDGTYHYVDIRKLPLSGGFAITDGMLGLERLRDRMADDFKEPSQFEADVASISLT